MPGLAPVFALLAQLGAPEAVLARQLPVPLRPPAAPPNLTGPVVTGCWLDLRYFRTLKAGVVDFCRGHLAYVPGDLDCYQFAEQVCSVFLPDTVEWTETRRVVAPYLFPCPDGPEPPVCPRMR